MKRLAICLLLLVFASADSVLAQPAFDPVGGCLVLHLEGRSTPGDLTSQCQRIRPPVYSGGLDFAGMYRWAAPPLAFAFEEAERGLTGRVTGLTGTADVVLVLVPDGLANAFTAVRVDKREQSYVISVSSGLVDFVEAIVSAQMLDYLDHQPGRPQGLGFQTWLTSAENGKAEWALKWPGAQPPISPDWLLRYVRTPAHSVYTFIFSHELAHIVMRRPSGGNTPAEVLATEMAVDRTAFRSISAASPNRQAMQLKGDLQPTFIVDVLAAVAHYESAKRRAILERLPGAPTAASITDLAPARDWITRALALVDQWDAICSTAESQAMCPRGGEVMRRDARTVLRAAAPGARVVSAFCEAFSRVFDSADHNFNEVAGAKDYVDKDGNCQSFAVTAEVPGFRSQSIWNCKTQDPPYYFRASLYSGQDSGAATDMYSRAKRTLSECLRAQLQEAPPRPGLVQRQRASTEVAGKRVLLELSKFQTTGRLEVNVNIERQ